MKIRPLKRSDIPLAAKIVKVNYSEKYEKKAFRELEATFKNLAVIPKYIVAEEKGEMLGFAGYVQAWMDYGIYEIFWVNVKPEQQNKGIGTKLVREAIEIIKTRKASMVLLTSKSPSFYAKKFGFKKMVKFKNGDWLMALKLQK
jgi:predicted N-acetyltransferase YhbS